MNNTNPKLPHSKNEDDSLAMEVDGEDDEMKTEETFVEHNRDEIQLCETGSGTVELNGVNTDYFEFDVIGHALGTSSNGKGAPSDPSKKYEDKNAARKAYLDALLKSLRKKKAKNNGTNDNDPYSDITLDSVGGLESQIAWLKQCILKSLKDKNIKNVWGIRPPKGVLFYGPPGTGKTLLARAFGNELSKELEQPVHFFHRKGGDTFSPYFGQSSENLRNLFQEAIDGKPSILFFDEIDGLCPRREGNVTSEAYNSVVTTLLGLMDTLPVGEVFVIGATNRLEAVDPAMLRPGRFDKHLEFLPPNLIARKKILEINTAKWKRESQPLEKDLEKLAHGTVGFSGADIEKLCREAFFAAFDRHVPDANLDAKIDNLKVLDEDWKKAVSNVKPTDTAVYGSTVYTPRLPDKAVNALVTNIQAEIVAKLIPLLPSCSESLNVGWAEETSSITTSTFLLSNSKSLSVDIIESMILPGVLIHDKINHLPVYILSHENILSQPGGSISELSYITETINQARNSFKPCILYIPRLDDLAKSGNARFIGRQLRQLSGKPVLVLATSFKPPQELPKGDDMQIIFGGVGKSLQVRRPRKDERKNFFLDTFEVMMKNTGNNSNVPLDPEFKETMDKLLENAVEQTENDPIELILALHDSLLQAADRYTKVENRRNLVVDLTRVMKDYAKTNHML